MTHSWDGDSVLLSILEHLGPGVEVPLPPGGNDLDVGLQGVVRHLKADLWYGAAFGS